MPGSFMPVGDNNTGCCSAAPAVHRSATRPRSRWHRSHDPSERSVDPWWASRSRAWIRLFTRVLARHLRSRSDQPVRPAPMRSAARWSEIWCSKAWSSALDQQRRSIRSGGYRTMTAVIAHETIEFAVRLGPMPSFTPPRSPQSNGMAESLRENVQARFRSRERVHNSRVGAFTRCWMVRRLQQEPSPSKTAN